jgi:hypothetical protein
MENEEKPQTEQEVENQMKELEEEELTSIDEDVLALSNELNSLKFFSDQVRFNSILYQGLTLLLEKVTKLEEKLNGPTTTAAAK